MANLKVFISYRRDDGFAAATVPRLYERLCERYGAENVFMDVDTIPPGVDFADHLSQAVAQSNVLLAVMGREWAKFIHERADDEDDFVRIEIESALERGIPVVPLLVGNAPMPKSAELPPSIALFSRRNGVPIDLARDFNAHVTRLADDLDRHYGEGAELAEPTPEPEETVAVLDETEASPIEDDFDIAELEDETQEPVDVVDSSESDFDLDEIEEESFEPEPALELDEIVNVPEVEKSSDQILAAEEDLSSMFGSPVAPSLPTRTGKRSPGMLVLAGVAVLGAIGLAVVQPWKEKLIPSSAGPEIPTPPPGEVEVNSKASSLGNPPPVPKASSTDEGQDYANSLGLEMVWCPPTWPQGYLRGEGSDQHKVILTQRILDWQNGSDAGAV